jgi:hypothetical protein
MGFGRGSRLEEVGHWVHAFKGYIMFSTSPLFTLFIPHPHEVNSLTYHTLLLPWRSVSP